MQVVCVFIFSMAAFVPCLPLHQAVPWHSQIVGKTSCCELVTIVVKCKPIFLEVLVQ